jgi:hypothetical protein
MQQYDALEQIDYLIHQSPVALDKRSSTARSQWHAIGAIQLELCSTECLSILLYSAMTTRTGPRI